jgi:polar amino acid transport system permease protein
LLVSTIAAWFRHLNATYGINLPYLYDKYDASHFWFGLLVTLELSVITVIASVIVGIIGAWMQSSSAVLPRSVAQGYVQLFRNTPPLVQLYFFYFGLSTLLPTVRGAYGLQTPLLSGFAWACVSLTLYAGSFNVEIFRSGIEAIPHATTEAAQSLGYKRLQMYRHIVLPLAIRICLPALTNNLVNLVKTTTLAYAVAVPELLYVSSQIWAEDGNVPEMMVTLLGIYLVLVGILAAGLRGLEHRLRVPGLGI